MPEECVKKILNSQIGGYNEEGDPEKDGRGCQKVLEEQHLETEHM